MSKVQRQQSILLLALFLFGYSAALAPAALLRPQLTVVQWNVENLFDNDDDPKNEADDEFLPNTWHRWRAEHYALKLDHLAEVLASMHADIICLQEVENRRVLDDLVDVLHEKHQCDYPYIIHREGPDHRGIDVAALSRFKPSATKWITPVAGQRDVLITRLAPYGAELVLFVNHWKSRWGGRKKTEIVRCQQALDVRSEVDRLLEENPFAAIMVVGDFNDNYSDDCIVNRLVTTQVDF